MGVRPAQITALALAFLAGFSTWILPHAAQDGGELEEYMTGLNWPVALAFAPDGRIFYAERFTGAIRMIQNRAVLPQPFYTLENTAASGEQGLLGLALDPAFPADPYVYAYHTFDDVTDGTVYNRVVRLRATGNVGTWDRVVLDRIPAAGIHNGGILAFGPDGTLYATDGDATNIAAAQDPSALNGKIFRMNPDGSVPSDNPFVGDPSANPYVYTYGHRNVFGLAFHPVTGRAFVTENGPACNDEVNLLLPGRNYGWGPSQTCSTPPSPPLNTNQDGPNPVLPLVWFTLPIAPTNAAVYAGPKFPNLQGDLILGDWNTGSLRVVDLVPPNYDTAGPVRLLVSVSEGVLDVEAGPDGAIWFTTQSRIYRYYDPREPPVALFTASNMRPRTREVVVFNATTSYDPTGSIVSYRWDFGDGTIGAGAVTSHAYDAPGTYPVELTVMDDESLTDTATLQILVSDGGPPPTPSSEFWLWIALVILTVVGFLVVALWIWRRQRA